MTILTPAEAPIRVAPAAIMSCTSSAVRMPPDALTPISGPTVARMSATSATVAPPVPQPVEVLTMSASASLARRQATTFSSSVSREVSMMTFVIAPASWQTSAIFRISSPTHSCIPLLSRPTLMTMSISRAPSRSARRVSRTFTSVVAAPSGKPMTEATATSVPARFSYARRTQAGFTQTAAKPYCFASAQRRSMSALVAAGSRSVWSM